MKFIKLIIQIIKSILTSSLLVLLIAMLLISFKDFITNRDIKTLLEIISITLFGIYLIYETYKDITRHQHKTYKYIILTDMVVLIAYSFIIYLQYKHYDNIDALIIRESNIRVVFLIISFTIFVKEYLKNEKYLN